MRTEIITQALTNEHEFRDIIGNKLNLYDFFVMSDSTQRLFLCVDMPTKCSVKGIYINSNSINTNNAKNCRLDIHDFMVVTDQIKATMPGLYTNAQSYVEQYKQNKLEEKNRPRDMHFILFSFIKRTDIINNLLNLKYKTNYRENSTEFSANDIENIKFAIKPFEYTFDYNYKIQSVKDGLNALKQKLDSSEEYYILTKDKTVVNLNEVKASNIKFFVNVDYYVDKRYVLYYDKPSKFSPNINIPFYISNDNYGSVNYKKHIDYGYYNKSQLTYFEYENIEKIFMEKNND